MVGYPVSWARQNQDWNP